MSLSQKTRRRKTRKGLYAIFALFATTLSAYSQSQVPQPAPLFEGLQKRHPKLNLSQQALTGEVSYSMDEQEVHFRWLYKGSQGKNRMAHQNESVSFWPTEVAAYDQDQILVAGRDTVSGNAIVERWTLAPPNPMPLPRVDPTTGVIEEPYVTVQVLSKRRILSTSEGTIWSMFRLHGTASSVMVQFWEDKEVHALDTSSGELAPLFLPAANPDYPDVTVIPQLSEVHKYRWSGTHEIEGHVYHLGVVEDVNDSHTCLLLFDHDMNGTIDSFGPVPMEEFWARDLDDADKFTAFY